MTMIKLIKLNIIDMTLQLLVYLSFNTKCLLAQVLKCAREHRLSVSDLQDFKLLY